MRMVMAWSLCLMLGVMQAFALPAHATETYDLLFRQGTLDGISNEQTLEYQRHNQIHFGSRLVRALPM